MGLPQRQEAHVPGLVALLLPGEVPADHDHPFAGDAQEVVAPDLHHVHRVDRRELLLRHVVYDRVG